MKCTLEIDMSNDAFADDPRGELARILREAADRLDESRSDNTRSILADPWLRDVNGNKVGDLRVTV